MPEVTAREKHRLTRPPCPDSAKPYVVWTTILASSLAFIDSTVVTVAMPQMRESLAASLSQIQWVTNAYGLTLSAFLLLGGAAGDAYGLKRVFMIGIALFGLASLWCGLSHSAEMLIAARTVQGIGGALMIPGSLALISANFLPEERGRAIGTWAAASGIAAALGPILGGWLIDIGPWQAIFWINVPVAALALWMCWKQVPDVPPFHAVGMDWLGGSLAVAGLGALALGLTSLSDANGARGLDLFFLLIGGVLLVTFVMHEKRADAPMMPLELFRVPAFAGVNALTLLLYFALAGALFFLPSTLIEAHGYSATRAGSVFLPFTLVMALLSRLGGTLADRFGVRPLLTIGPVITGVSFGFLALAAADGRYWFAIVPVMTLMGLGMGITVAPLSTTVMNSVPADRMGVASGINNAISRVAGLIAVASLGAVAVLGFQRIVMTADPAVAAILGHTTFGAPPPTPINASASGRVAEFYAHATVTGFGTVALICALAAILSGYFGYRSTKSV
ncbi:MFS transporter [Microvirga terricola]|uniref:MFS transporter n=1 Tax=Microvirga terricola TaxID=2719797 RepID=A0ABX0V952_9HYPH|nr:MFS transporter [Microvirga terricola]NIX76349.1 MFS transporter [Microvirga terricola]